MLALIGGTPMGVSKRRNVRRRFDRIVMAALARPLTISLRRRSFRGPAWAVLFAYAMWVGAGVVLTVGLVVAQVIQPKALLQQVLHAGRSWIFFP